MALAHDAFTTSGDYYATPDPATVSHTPSGTPAGVVVWVVHVADFTDDVVSVDYGTLSLTKLGFESPGDSGEDVGVSCWWAGSSIPTGTQTVSVDHDASGGRKRTYVWTITASGDVEVSVHGGNSSTSGSSATVNLDSGTDTAIKAAALACGRGVVGQVTPISGMTEMDEADLGSLVVASVRKTTIGSGFEALGWTLSANDEFAVYGVGLKEAASGTSYTDNLASEVTVTADVGTDTAGRDDTGMASEATLTTALGTDTQAGTDLLDSQVDLTAALGQEILAKNDMLSSTFDVTTAIGTDLQAMQEAMAATFDVTTAVGTDLVAGTVNMAALFDVTTAITDNVIKAYVDNLASQVDFTAAVGTDVYAQQDLLASLVEFTTGIGTDLAGRVEALAATFDAATALGIDSQARTDLAAADVEFGGATGQELLAKNDFLAADFDATTAVGTDVSAMLEATGATVELTTAVNDVYTPAGGTSYTDNLSVTIDLTGSESDAAGLADAAAAQVDVTVATTDVVGGTDLLSVPVDFFALVGEDNTAYDDALGAQADFGGRIGIDIWSGDPIGEGGEMLLLGVGNG